ncbi:MAG: hypothetical protein IID42_06910 [Planctomycetes bacterium]|nr:hypothetical protein [Planctomycetota bacterium]
MLFHEVGARFSVEIPLPVGPRNWGQSSASEIVGRLAMFDIRPLGNGFAFYYGPGSLSRWLGMVITATLLTFGAPFWFNTLSDLVSLRDVLAPQKGKKVDDEG